MTVFLYRLSEFVKMKAAVDKRDWVTAAAEMKDSKWYKQMEKMARDLVRRMKNIKCK